MEDIYHKDPPFEIARLNKYEKGNVLFPIDRFKIQVWSKDHNPPHFHVIGEGWNITFEIETGNVLKIEEYGDSHSTRDYIVTNVPRWLKLKNKILPKLTNRENADLSWDIIHEDD